MRSQPGQAIVTGLGPLSPVLPAPTNTAPLTATGILNLANLGTTPVKVLSGATVTTGGGFTVRRCKLVGVSAANVAWTTVATGATAPTITALAAGAATEGSLIFGGSGATEWLTVPDDVDLYLVAGGAATVINLTVFQQ